MRPITLLLPLFVLYGCDGTKPGDSGDTGSDTADTSDTSDTANLNDFCAVQSLFQDKCVVCHSTTSHQGDLDLETDPYNAIVNVTSPNYPSQAYVTPGNADTSFLYLKMTDAQSTSEGTVMPTAGQLPASDTETVRAWILAGATSECGNPDTDTSTTAYHPDGFDDPAVHGMEAKYQDQQCTSCHGADLTGADDAVSCDSCHPSGWRQDCTYCHGGTDDMSGAPPVDIDNLTTDLSFPEHTVHGEPTIHAAWDCVQCHVTPDDVLSAGHLFVGDTSKGLAEVDFADGLSAGGSSTAGSGTCNNIYCHGDGQRGSVGDVSSGGSSSCHMCHGDQTSSRGMSGEHDEHLGERLECGECHSDVLTGNASFTHPDRHVDGTIDVHLPSGMNWSGGRCTGACHGEDHEGEDW